MRVCLATLRHEFRNSGEIESVVNLQDYLRKNGIMADILTPKGFYVASMPESRSGFFWGKACDLWRLYRVLQRHCAGYDIIHLFLPFPAFSIYGDFIKHKLRTKVVITFESCVVTSEGAGRARFFEYEPFSNLLRLCINNRLLSLMSCHDADSYVVSSRYQKEQLAYENIHVIPNLTSTKRFCRGEKHEARKLFGFADDVFVISYIGHALAIKGIADLLLAFSLLTKDNGNIRLAVAFSGIGRPDKVRALVRKLGIVDKVFFFGSVSVSEFLTASDLLVVPYRYSFGTNWLPSILLEGFSVGIPILTSDLAPLRELNETRETLFFARAGDYRHLASMINKLTKNCEKLETVVRNQKELMYTILNPDKLVGRFIGMYNMVQDEKN